MGHQGTIEIRSTNGNKYVNRENVTYVQTQGVNHTLGTYVLLFALTLMALSAGVVVSTVATALTAIFVSVVGLLLVALAFLSILESGKRVLGTLTGEISVSDGHAIADDLTERPMGTIAVHGRKRTSLKEYIYRHLFVVDNVVSVERRTKGMSGSELGLLFVLGVVGVVLLSESVIAGSVWLLIVAAVFYVLSNKPDTLIITLQNGTEEEFVMEEQDVSKVVNDFREALG